MFRWCESNAAVLKPVCNRGGIRHKFCLESSRIRFPFNITFKTELGEGSLHGGGRAILCELRYQPVLRGDKKTPPNHFHFLSVGSY